MIPTLRNVLLLCALLASTIGGCAYFNLFYNAEQAFEEAENIGKDVDPQNQPTNQQKANYRRCITKCEMLLEEYPESDLVDDALFLMGKSYFRLREPREYRSAIRNFDAVLSNFPQSKHRSEALYLKALSHLSLGEEQIALDSLRRLRESDPGNSLAVEATFRLGDRYAENGDYAQAILQYERYREEHPKHEARSRVALRHAQVLLDLDRDAEAVELLETVDPKKMPRESAFRALFLRAEALYNLDRPEEALDLMDVLNRDAAINKMEPEVKILNGQVELALGDEEEGVKLLLEVVADHLGRPPEVRAKEALARYYLERYGPDSDQLRDELTIARDEKTAARSSPELTQLRERIDRYENLQMELSERDSTTSGRPGFFVNFRLAELLFAELDRPQEALGYYQAALAAAPDSSSIGPKSAYAIGYIQEEYFASPDSAAAAYAALEARFPDSPQARARRGEVFLEAVARGQTAAAGLPGVGAGDGFSAPGSFGGSPAASPWRALRLGGPGASSGRGS